MDIKNTCFVCKEKIASEDLEMNLVLNMNVCKTCKGTDKEKKAEQEHLDSLAEDFVCGCI